jgi:2-amino-4-hydroxy-6-hydroxymethyldihydropteridine diphosphokinase
LPPAGSNSPTLAAIGLGSNLGDRRATLQSAAERLSDLLTDLRVSSFYDTDPVHMVGDAPAFLNAAAVGTTTLSARELLVALHGIEREAGRQRPFPNASRTLDLDLLLFGEQQIREPWLTVPHPMFRERRFVLAPLSEIAASMRDPVTSLTVGELLARLPPGPAVRRL